MFLAAIQQIALEHFPTTCCIIQLIRSSDRVANTLSPKNSTGSANFSQPKASDDGIIVTLHDPILQNVLIFI